MDAEADRAAVSIVSDSGGRDLQKLVGRDERFSRPSRELTSPCRPPGDRGTAAA